MITKIGLRNFKCFSDLEISPKLVTVLIGPNGTGKSGVLQALLLLKQSKDASQALDLHGDLVRIGEEDFMLHSADSESDIVGVSLSGDWPVYWDRLTIPVDFNVYLSFTPDASKTLSKTGNTRFEFGQVPFVIAANTNDDWTTIQFGYLELSYAGAPGIDVAEMTFSGSKSLDHSIIWPVETFDHFLEDASHAPTRVMETLRSVPAARALARQVYQLGPRLVNDISHVNGLGQQEEDTATSLVYSSSDVSKISDWMKEVTGVGFRMDMVPPVSTKPVSLAPAGEVSLVAEGFGTNALVRLLFELARAERGATLLIEEPELHLHPKAQGDLTQVLVEEAKSNDKQIIMTTHGEHMLGRLLVLVAEGVISKEEVAIYAFEKDDRGICSATEIEVTDRGQTMGGLPGFYDANLDEMDRLVEALRKNS